MISLDQFNALNLLRKDGLISRKDLAKLRPYKVDNAIIMAAGLASRFTPLSYEKPKALIKVKGEVLIERQIRQLREAGIQDITLVVGYKKELFSYLREKLGVKIVVNEDYYRYNNTSTLMRVLPRLKNTYICSSDNYFTENVFEPYVYKAYYAATYFSGAANEWGLECNKDGRIVGIDHSPVDMWCMMGHVYFSAEFSRRFCEILKKQYAKGSIRVALWEAVYEHSMRHLDMSIRRYPRGVIHEFDSLDDLREFDRSYVNRSGSKILRKICRRLKCAESDIGRFKVICGDEKNLVFSFWCKDVSYLYSNESHSIRRIEP